MDELSEEDKLTVARARKIQKFLSQPFQVAEVFTGHAVNWSPWNRPFLDSQKSFLENTITYLRSPFTWLETSQRSLKGRTIDKRGQRGQRLNHSKQQYTLKQAMLCI